MHRVDGLNCDVCQAGYSSGGATVVCTACAAGKWVAASVGGATTTCANCNAGTWALAGTAGTATCSGNCAAGTYAAAGAGLTSACTNCAAGTYSLTTAASCTNCPAGSTSTVGGGTTNACTACAAGKYALSGDTSCTNCPAGSYSTSGTGTTATCTVCPTGSYSAAGTGITNACTVCPAGTYAASTGTATCTNCAANTYSAATGATSSATCTACTAGLTSAAGSTSAAACTSGPTTQSFTGTVASFVFQPTTSHSATTAVDSADLIGLGQWAAYAGSATDGVAWLYQLGKYTDSTSAVSALSLPTNAAACSATTCYVYKLYSRKLYSANFTTFGASGVAAPATSDASTQTTYTWNTPSAMTSTIDQVAWATTYLSTNVFVEICVAMSAGAPVCKSKTTSAATAVTIHSLWCDSVNKNCYALVGSTVAAAVTYQIYGVTSAGTELWTAGFVTVGTQGAITGTAAGVIWGNSTTATLNTAVNVAYWDGAVGCATTGVCTIKYASVAVAAATIVTVPATPATIVSNTATAIYSPCGGVVTNTTNALLLCFQNALTSATPTVYNVTAVFNPYSATTYTLTYLNVTKITSPFIGAWGSYYGSGMFIISYAGSASSYSAYYNTYSSTGSNLTNGGLTLGTFTAPSAMGNWFITANSSLGYGYFTFDSTESNYLGTAASSLGRTTTSMAGGVANSMYAGATSGNVLASFVAFITMMIASLFVF